MCKRSVGLLLSQLGVQFPTEYEWFSIFRKSNISALVVTPVILSYILFCEMNLSA